MTAERLQLDSYRPGEPTRDANGSLRDVAQLQERLRRIEDMKGLDARMSEAQKQVRALREQIRKKDSRVASIKASGSSQYTGTSTATSTATSSANSATAATGSKTSSQSSFSSYSSSSSGRNDAVEKELMKLKREMKNK